MEESPLPELHDAVLDAGTLASLLNDLEVVAEVLEVRAKGGASQRGVSLRPSVSDARTALGDGQSVQVRYAHGGATWCDTLMPVSGGVRVVRMRL